MNTEIKGKERSETRIQTLIDFLNDVSNSQLWEYMGLIVEIDPTIDYNNENILVRWLDINEGFNDKIIVNSLVEFNRHFNQTTV